MPAVVCIGSTQPSVRHVSPEKPRLLRDGEPDFYDDVRCHRCSPVAFSLPVKAAVVFHLRKRFIV